MSANSSSMDGGNSGANAGWIAGFLMIAGVLVFGAILWFTYHP
jgi:hypothetical protein